MKFQEKLYHQIYGDYKHGQHQHGPAQNQRTGVALPCCSDALPRWRGGKCSLKPQRFLSGGSLSSVVLIVIILTVIISFFLSIPPASLPALSSSYLTSSSPSSPHKQIHVFRLFQRRELLRPTPPLPPWL